MVIYCNKALWGTLLVKFSVLEQGARILFVLPVNSPHMFGTACLCIWKEVFNLEPKMEDGDARLETVSPPLLPEAAPVARISPHRFL
jgi:hypothetical protein